MLRSQAFPKSELLHARNMHPSQSCQFVSDPLPRIVKSIVPYQNTQSPKGSDQHSRSESICYAVHELPGNNWFVVSATVDPNASPSCMLAYV
jgi:hypothetical protein